MSNVDVRPRAEVQRSGKENNKRTWPYLLDGLVIVGMGILLYFGALLRYLVNGGEPTRYRCYALAFWNGVPSLGPLRKTDCWFIVTTPATPIIHRMQAWHFPGFMIKLVEQQSPLAPLHALPHEYPLLAIFPFTLTLLAPYQWFLLEFAVWMTLVAGIIYFILKRGISTGAALAFAFYLVVGNWATALARFDLIPVGLTLGAVILAERKRWRWAFALLALAILLKFYALVLIPPLFIAQQLRYRGSKWYALRRWDGMLTFLAVCVVVTSISLVLSVDGTLGPLEYFRDRPIQVETLAAAVLWMGQFAGYHVRYVYTFGSLNAISALSSKVSPLTTLCFAAGLLYTYWLQLRGKLDVFTTSLLALLISMITGKIFSPQYLMWVAPFIAYIGKSNRKWLLSWGIICVLTTSIYPFIYTYAPDVWSVPRVPLFYPFVFLRGAIILGIIFALFYRANRTEVITPPIIPRFSPRWFLLSDRKQFPRVHYKGPREPGALK